MRLTTTEALRRIDGMIDIFPEYDWIELLEQAADRQVKHDPEANSLDLITDAIIVRRHELDIKIHLAGRKKRRSQ